MTPDTPDTDRTDAEADPAACSLCGTHIGAFGGYATSTLGGEHIWKCSEIVPNAAIEQLAEEWETQRTGDKRTDEAFERAASRLRELLRSTDTDNEQSGDDDLVTDGGQAEKPDPIQRVKDANGDLVLDYNSRIGARPYARYVDGEWQLMSLTHVPTPDYGMDDPDAEGGVNTAVHTVDLEPDPDDWTEEELREIAEQPRYPHEEVEGWPGVEVIDYQDSPFEHREEIPARDEIVQEIECSSCGEEFRQYLPDPFHECPHCENELEVIEGSASSGFK